MGVQFAIYYIISFNLGLGISYPFAPYAARPRLFTGSGTGRDSTESQRNKSVFSSLMKLSHRSHGAKIGEQS